MNFTQDDIRAWFAPHFFGAELELYVHESLPSTQTEAKRVALQCHSAAVVIANAQSQGRGRMGRSFFSPPDTGIYMSCILPINTREDAQRAVFRAAVAVCQAIEAVSAVSLGIKWVNDIFLRGKKVAGILSECVEDPISQEPCAAIIGIGVNLNTQDFPPDIANMAGGIGADAPRARVIAEILSRLYGDAPPFADTIARYSARLIGINRRVIYTRGDRHGDGVLLGVNGHGELLLKCDNGVICTLNSGEITLGSAQFLEG